MSLVDSYSIAEQQSKIQNLSYTLHLPFQNAFLDILDTLRQLQMALNAKSGEVDILVAKVNVLEGMDKKVNDLQAIVARDSWKALESKIQAMEEKFEDRFRTLEQFAHGSLDGLETRAAELNALKVEMEELSAKLMAQVKEERPQAEKSTVPIQSASVIQAIQEMEARVADLEKNASDEGIKLSRLENLLGTQIASIQADLEQVVTQDIFGDFRMLANARAMETNQAVESLQAMSDEQSAKLMALSAVFETQAIEHIRLTEKSREHDESITTLQKRLATLSDGPLGLGVMANDVAKIRKELQQKSDQVQMDTQRQDLEQSLKVIRSTMVRTLGKFEQFIMQHSGTTAGQVAEHDKMLADLGSDVQHLVVQERVAQMAGTTHCLSCFRDYRSASPPPMIRGGAGFPSDQVDEHLVVLPQASPASIPKSMKGNHPNGMSPFHLQELEQGNVLGGLPSAQVARGAQLVAEAIKHRPASASRGRAMRPQSAQKVASIAATKAGAHAPADMRT